ncbi:hypothetical protein, partial [Limosilactobacillus fermentum]|uniref:hypothetical protein n=1 Tax=Limosilactobacillus fermentum TaxID=1613 RepID=UPI0021BEE554
KLVHGESLRILIGFLAISIIRGRLSLFQYPQGINLHKIFYTPIINHELYARRAQIIQMMNQFFAFLPKRLVSLLTAS